MGTFSPQLVIPAAGNPYYNTPKNGGFNPCIQGNPQRREKNLNVLPNCVGYATGRFNEIIGSGNCKYLGNTNAANFVDLARRQGLLIRQTPTPGGCMVWKGGKTGEGHVAIVELMMGSRIVTSESEYYGKAFTIYQRFGKNWSDGCYWMNSSYTFLGCIVNPAVQDEEDKHKAGRHLFPKGSRVNSWGYEDVARTLDTLYMEYIPGTALADEAGEKDIDELLRLVKRFRAIPDWRSDIGAYCENLLTHSKSEETEWVIREIQTSAAELTEKVSFSHGDLSLSNVIRSTDGSIKIIDPNNKGDYSSYLLDLAKIRFSMTGYERLFGFGKADLRNLRDAFDRKTEDGRLVQLLEITHWIRLYKYRTEEQRKTVDRVIDELIKEYGERWS